MKIYSEYDLCRMIFTNFSFSKSCNIFISINHYVITNNYKFIKFILTLRTQIIHKFSLLSFISIRINFSPRYLHQNSPLSYQLDNTPTHLDIRFSFHILEQSELTHRPEEIVIAQWHVERLITQLPVRESDNWDTEAGWEPWPRRGHFIQAASRTVVEAMGVNGQAYLSARSISNWVDSRGDATSACTFTYRL